MNDRDAAAKYLVAITGASGMLFLPALLQVLCRQDIVVHGICSDAGRKVLAHEEGLAPEQLSTVSRWFDVHDFTASPASGSSGYAAMIVIPCSMGTLAAIASGLSINLIHRAADVILKERKKLILAVRETPLSRTHLQNMLRAHDSGAIICPPMPSFYLKPQNLQEAAETYAWRLADQLDLVTGLRKSWGD